jgi:hypothetical protein
LAVLFLLSILGRFFAKPLLAQVRAALVADIDTPARAPYQSGVFIRCADHGFTCEAAGNSVPPGKRLTITNVSGAFDLYTQPGQAVDLVLEHGLASGSPPPSNMPLVFFPTFFQGTDSGVDAFVVNAPVSAHFDPPDYPKIVLSLGANNTTKSPFIFALSGYVVDCAAAPCAPITF